MPARAPRQRRLRPVVVRLALATAFLAPPLVGLVLVHVFFGGLGPGLWIMAGVVFLFAATLVIGLARAERVAAPGDHRR